jgi:DNA polymerase III gamma/tau subunit
MQQKSFNILERIMKKEGATLPLIVDRHTAELAMHLFGAESIDWDTIETGEYTDISIYRKNEDKKHLSIENMRLFEKEIREIPYSGKSLFVLIDFDEATEDAMNAILKILEEPPEYARILLVVSSPEGIIDTIRSRALTFFERDTVKKDDGEMTKRINSYAHGSKEELLKYIYK